MEGSTIQVYANTDHTKKKKELGFSDNNQNYIIHQTVSLSQQTQRYIEWTKHTYIHTPLETIQTIKVTLKQS